MSSGFDQDIEQIRKDYKRHTNIVNAFLYEECDVDISNSAYSTLATLLYGKYVRFCEKRNIRAVDMAVFGKKLAAKGILNNRHMDRGSSEHYYDGVLLVNQNTEDREIPAETWNNKPTSNNDNGR